MTKKRTLILIAVIVVICCCVAALFLLPEEADGVTLASREALLQDLPKGIDWQIASEISIGSYLVSSIYSPTKDGLAVFEPQKNGGYKNPSIRYGNKGDIIIDHAIIDQIWYDIFWLDQANLSYAEIVYTVDGQQLAPLRLEVQNSPILYQQAPGDDYTLNIRYYDIDGNIYQ